jgi:hypothetical protein
MMTTANREKMTVQLMSNRSSVEPCVSFFKRHRAGRARRKSVGLRLFNAAD